MTLEATTLEPGAEDVPAWVDLLRSALPSEPFPAEAVGALLAHVPGRVPLRLEMRRHGRTVGVAAASFVDGAGYVDLVAVHPDDRDGGVGRALLQDLEARLVAVGAGELRVGGNSWGYAWPGVSTTWAPGIAMLVRHGYRRTDAAVNLTASTACAPAVVGHPEVSLDRGTITDLRDAQEFARTVFSTTWEHELGVALRHPGATVWLAHRGDDVVGFVATGVFVPDVLGPIAVDPSLHGGGVGAALLRSGLADLRDRGFGRARIGWAAESATPFYVRTVGAEVDEVFWVMTKSVPGRSDSALVGQTGA